MSASQATSLTRAARESASVVEPPAKYVHIWEYDVVEDRIEEFLLHYGDAGTWTSLFGRARGYLGTQLLRSRTQSSRFLTIDAWQSELAFADFLERFRQEYESLDLACEHLTRREIRLGAFSTATSPICSGCTCEDADWLAPSRW